MTVQVAARGADARAAVAAYRPFEVTVREVRQLTPHFRRITFTGADLDLFGATCLDQRVKVVLPLAGAPEPFAGLPRGGDWYPRWRELPESRRNPFRTYTARAVRPAAREVDIDFVHHGDAGPASSWAARAQVGDPAVVVGPDARGDSALGGVEWSPGGARQVLLAGDETAVPAICSILESLPAHVRGQAFLEVPSHKDLLPVDGPQGVRVHWLPRATGDARRAQAPAVHGEQLWYAVRTHLAVPPHAADAYAWLAGRRASSGTCGGTWSASAAGTGGR